MSTRLKMAASAAVAAALTAALFLTLSWEPSPRSDPPTERTAADALPDSIAPSGATADEVAIASGARIVARDLPRIEGSGVRGRVVTEEGDGVVGVVIVATPRRESGGSLTGNAPQDLEDEIRKAVERTYRRVTGTWWLQAVQCNDRERMSEPQEITLEVGAPEQTVLLILRERPGLRGAIIVNDDLDVQRVDVWALRFEGDEPPPLDGLRGNRGALRGRCDIEPKRYSFRDIGPGRYFVWVTLGSTRVMGSSVVEIQDRMVEQDIEVGIDDPDRYVVVRAIGPDGELLDVRSTSFSTSYRGPGISSSGGVEAIHLTDGSWLIAPDPRMPAQADHPGGTYRIKVTHRILGSQEIVCDPKTQRELEFRFGEVSTLTVTVSGLDESGLTARASLYLKTHMEPNSISFSGRPVRSSGNAFVVDKVQPGEWFLVLVADGIQVDRMSITVSEGENPIQWSLPPLHTVRLEPANKEKSVRFGLTRLDPGGNWMHQFASSAKGGAAVFKYVPAGRYELTGSYEGEKRRILIDVPGQTHIRLE